MDARDLHEELIQRLDLRRTDIRRMSDAQLWQLAQRHLREILDQRGGVVGQERSRLEKSVLQEVVGLGALEDLLADDSISEIMINGPDDIFVERAGRITRSPAEVYRRHGLLAA